MIRSICTAVAVVLIGVTGSAGHRNVSQQGKPTWQEEFGISKRTLMPTGRNQYFILEPGFQLVLEDENEKVEIIVLDETKQVNGVLTRVVEEREWENGELAEVSKNFFAIDEKTQDVFYFGEEVDLYEDGEVVKNSGAWIAGNNGAKPGLIMPGEPKVGMKYYQEIAPNVAMDRAEIVSLDDTLKTPAGLFTKCLKTMESTPLDSNDKEFKIYAPGIGLVQDENLLLTKYGFIEKK